MAFSTFERTVALRYLWSRRRGDRFVSVSALLSLLGIALGVAALIIVMSVMNGMRGQLLTQVLGLNGHLTVDLDGAAPDLTGVAGLRAITPVREGQVMITGPGGRAAGAVVRGMRPADFRARPQLADSVRRGDLDAFGGTDTLLLGYRLAAQLQVGPGDKVRLVAPERGGAFGARPRMRHFSVVGLVDTDMYQYDSGYAFIPLAAAESLFGAEGPDRLEVFLDGPDAARKRVPDLQAAVGDAGTVRPWQEANAAFFNALIIERNVTFVILTLVILVAALNIISSLVMLVKTKSRDIAILRTMGASRAMVARAFVIAGASIGVIGTALGAALGLGFAAHIDTLRQALESLPRSGRFAGEIAFLANLPATIEPLQVTLVIALALGLSLAATILPAWRAARLDPVEALRQE